MEAWRRRMIDLMTHDLRARPAQELCVIRAVELVRIVDAIIWVLDDGRRPPLEIYTEALQLASKAHLEVHARIARCSATLAGNIVVGLAVIKRIDGELLSRMTPSGVAWWKTVVEPPTWMPEQMRASYGILPGLLKGLAIDRLDDSASPDSRDLQSEALAMAASKYHAQMKQLAQLLPPDLDFAPLEASVGVPAQPRGERWTTLDRARGPYMRGFILQLSPLVSGFDPAQAARQGVRTTFERRAAKKRGGTGGRHARLQGTVQERSSECSLDETPESLFLTLDGAAPEHRTAEDQAVARETHRKALESVQRRFGAKVRRFVEALDDGMSVSKAAEAAGVSRQMGHRYLRKLRGIQQ